MKSSLLLGLQVSRGPGDTHAWCGPLRVGSLPRKVKHTLRLETRESGQDWSGVGQTGVRSSVVTWGLW